MTKSAVLLPASVVCSYGAARKHEDRWAITCRAQSNPWFLFDFGASHQVETIEIGHTGCPERSVAMRASFSEDGFVWRQARAEDKGPRFMIGVNAPARLVVLSFEGFTDVHVPVKFRGQAKSENRGFGNYYPESGAYELVADAGYFSNMLVAVSDILGLAAEGREVNDIDMRRSYGYYRETGDQDVYALFHDKDLSVRVAGELAGSAKEERIPRSGWNRIQLASLPFQSASRVVEKFFRFNGELRQAADSVASDLGVDFARTICVYYRGTDKAKEFRLAPVSRYIEICGRLAGEHPGHRIFVQSDDAAAVSEFCQHFGSRAFTIPDVPVSTDGTPVHIRTKAGRIDGLRKFLIAFQCMTASRFIVCTNSNVSLALALYRGSAHNMISIREDGEVYDYCGQAA